MTFTVNTTLLGRLAQSLISEEDNFVSKLIGTKLEQMGKDFVKDLIHQSVGKRAREAAEILGAALITGSPAEFRRARDQWLNVMNRPPLTGQASRLSTRLQQAYKNAANEERGFKRQGNWRWSKSRQEWLNEDWKHDWRSQPRDKIGRWIPGRLNHIYMTQGAKKSRSVRRRAVRKQVREMMRGN